MTARSISIELFDCWNILIQKCLAWHWAITNTPIQRTLAFHSNKTNIQIAIPIIIVSIVVLAVIWLTQSRAFIISGIGLKSIVWSYIQDVETFASSGVKLTTKARGTSLSKVKTILVNIVEQRLITKNSSISISILFHTSLLAIKRIVWVQIGTYQTKLALVIIDTTFSITKQCFTNRIIRESPYGCTPHAYITFWTIRARLINWFTSTVASWIANTTFTLSIIGTIPAR